MSPAEVNAYQTDALQGNSDQTPAEAPRAVPAWEKRYSPEQLAAAEKRKNIIAPMLSAGDGESLTEIAKRIAAEQQLSVATIWRWHSAFKGRKLRGLVREPRADRGSFRMFAARPKLKRYVAKMDDDRLNISHIAALVKKDWGSSLLPYGGEPPSGPTIRRFLANNAERPPAMRDFKRLTKQEWDAKHAPYLVTLRGVHRQVNECLVADHRRADVLVVNDVFWAEPWGAAIRLWKTYAMDERSRFIAGVWWSAEPNWYSIVSALRQAIGTLGLPKYFYTDNGKDFKKVGKPGGHLERLGIQPLFCTPRHPQAKSVESHFRLVRERFDKLFEGRGYTGSNSEGRSDACRQDEKKHREWVAGKRERSPFLMASEFMRTHAQWLKEDYHEDWKHGGCGMEDRTPAQVLEDLLPAGARQIPSMVELESKFWDEQVRRVTNCRVSVNGESYAPALGDGIGGARMLYASGRDVAVRVNPDDLSCAVAYENEPSGEKLADLVADRLVAWGPVTKEQMGAICHDRAKLRKAVRRAAEAYSQGAPSALEMLERRSGLQRQPVQRPRLPATTAPRVQLFACDVNEEDARLIAEYQAQSEAESAAALASPFVSDAMPRLLKAFTEEEKG